MAAQPINVQTAGTNSCKNVPAEQTIARPKSQSAEQTKSTLHCAAAAFLLLSLSLSICAFAGRRLNSQVLRLRRVFCCFMVDVLDLFINLGAVKLLRTHSAVVASEIYIGRREFKTMGRAV